MKLPAVHPLSGSSGDEVRELCRKINELTGDLNAKKIVEGILREQLHELFFEQTDLRIRRAQLTIELTRLEQQTRLSLAEREKAAKLAGAETIEGQGNEGQGSEGQGKTRKEVSAPSASIPSASIPSASIPSASDPYIDFSTSQLAEDPEKFDMQ